MKKIVAIIILILVSIFIWIIVTNVTKEDKVIIDIQELVLRLKKEPIFEDKLDEIDRESIIKKYKFNDEKIKNIISYIGTGATAEEILVIELFNKKDIEQIRKLIEGKIEERKQDFQNYLPKEVFKLENYNLETINNYIILCICNDYKKAEEIINHYIHNQKE